MMNNKENYAMIYEFSLRHIYNCDRMGKPAADAGYWRAMWIERDCSMRNPSNKDAYRRMIKSFGRVKSALEKGLNYHLKKVERGKINPALLETIKLSYSKVQHSLCISDLEEALELFWDYLEPLKKNSPT